MLRGGLFPHPPIIIPEIGGKRRFKATATIEACENLASEMAAREADLIVAIGPHGPVDRQRITISAVEKYRGDLGYFGAPELNFSLPGQPGLAQEIAANFSGTDKEVKLLQQGKEWGELDHGILVPLYFLQQAGLQEVPWLILNMTFWKSEKLYNFGQELARYLKESSAVSKPLFLVSGDLSHRTEPGAPGGYSPAGEEFDRKLMDALAANDISGVLNLDPALIEEAGECGYRPLLVGLGFSELMAGESNLDIEVLSYEAPFGVGYGVASFNDGR